MHEYVSIPYQVNKMGSIWENVLQQKKSKILAIFMIKLFKRYYLLFIQKTQLDDLFLESKKFEIEEEKNTTHHTSIKVVIMSRLQKVFMNDLLMMVEYWVFYTSQL